MGTTAGELWNNRRETVKEIGCNVAKRKGNRLRYQN